LVVKRQVLTNGRIILRPFKKQDVELLFQAISESKEELIPWLQFCHPDYSIEETRLWLSSRDEDWKAGKSYDFAIMDAESGAFLGGCGLNQVNNECKMANLGYWVRTSWAGRGIATAVVLLLAKFGFKELKLNRIEIMADVENKRSQRVAEKTGAVREGVLRNRLVIHGQVRDVVLFSLIPQDIGGWVYEVSGYACR
jgi:ribosomal-protein-serine acetyltransferase